MFHTFHKTCLIFYKTSLNFEKTSLNFDKTCLTFDKTFITFDKKFLTFQDKHTRKPLRNGQCSSIYLAVVFSQIIIFVLKSIFLPLPCFFKFKNVENI